MYSNNSAQAIGFAGLSQYVSEIDKILDRCCRVPAANHATDELDDTADLSETVVDLSWIDEPDIESFVATDDYERTPLMLESASAAEQWHNDSPRKGRALFTGIAAVLLLGGVATGVWHSVSESPGEITAPETGSLLVGEEPPPVGRGLVLNSAQIRFCLAQGIRLGAAAENTESLGRNGAARLKDMYDDYDGRCREYRFQAGAFEQARRSVESHRLSLEREGLALFSVAPVVVAAVEPQSHSGDSGPQLQIMMGEAPRLADAPAREVSRREPVLNLKPRTYIKNMQWRLFKLKYYAGPIDGVDSKATRDALRGFFSAHPEHADSNEEKVIFRAVDRVYTQKH